MGFVCFRTGYGPFCSDKRLETTAAHQADCIKIGRIRALSGAYEHLAKQWKGLTQLRRVDDTGESCLMPTCLNDLLPYIRRADTVRPFIEKCYCPSAHACKWCDEDDQEEEDRNEESPDDDQPPQFRERTTENRLRPLGTTDSCWGCPIPMPFGTVILPGNVIWVGNATREEVVTRVVTGDEAAVTREEFGFVDIVVGLGTPPPQFGEIAGISRIWFGEELVYNANITIGEQDQSTINRTTYDKGMTHTFYNGTRSQKVSTLMTLVDGFGRTPAYRDLAYVLFRKYPVDAADNNIPSIRVEVIVERDETAPVFDTSVIGPLDSDLFQVNDASRRAYVSDGTDILAVDLETLTQVGTIEAETTIDPTTVVVTQEENLVFRDNSKTHFVNGSSPNDRWSSASLEVGPMASIRIQDRFTDVVNPILIADDYFIHVHKARHFYADFQPFVTLNLDFWAFAGLGLAEPIEFLGVEDVSNVENSSTNKVAFALLRESANQQMYLCQWTLVNQEKFLAMHEDMPVRVDPIMYGPLGLSPTSNLVGHVYDDRRAESLFFFDDNTMLGWSWITNSITWFLVCPPLNGFKNRKRLGITSDYKYVSGSTVNYIDLRRRRHYSLGTLADYSAPAIAGPQWYDPSKDVLAYLDATGEITKLYLSRIVSDLPSVADVARGALLSVGLSEDQIDVSSVAGITMTGFLISDQQNAAVVVDELCNFFQLSAMDVGGRLTLRPLATVSSITIDNDEQHDDSQERDVVVEKNVWSARVRYFDTTRNGGDLFTQSVGRDVFSDDNDYLSNIEETEFSAAVFTDPDTARRAAERYLLRLIQREDRLELYVGQKNFAFEPSDFIVFDNKSYRVRRIENDTSFETKIIATTDDVDNYTPVTGLSGLTSAVVNAEVRDFDAPVRNFAVAFDLPSLMENPETEAIYVGLTNPDSTPPFTATPVYSRSPNSTKILGGTPTGKAIVGRLITPPLSITAEFTTDQQSSMVIKFDDAVPGGVLANVAVSTLWESYDQNVILVGREVIQYGNYSVAMDGKTVTFTNLLRARFSTDDVMHTHVAGERCMLYDPARMIRIPITDGAASARQGVGMTLDTRNPYVFKDDVVQTIAKLDAALHPVGLRLKKTATLGQVRLSGRSPFENPFIDSDVAGDGQLNNVNPDSFPFVAVLTAPYNATTFEEAYIEGNWDFSTESVGSHPGAYIAVVIANMQDWEPTFSESFLTPHGMTLEQDLYMAMFTVDKDTLHLTGTSSGWFFPGDATYSRWYQPGRRV